MEGIVFVYVMAVVLGVVLSEYLKSLNHVGKEREQKNSHRSGSIGFTLRPLRPYCDKM